MSFTESLHYISRRTNVALHKKAFYCDLRVPMDNVVDGTMATYSHMNDKCSYIAFISVDLMEQYSIQSIIVITGL